MVKKSVYWWWKIYRLLHRFFPSPYFTEYCLNFIAENINAARGKYEIMPCLNLEGGHLLLRMEAVRQVGLFDLQYFLGCEEEELTGRIRKQGWKLYAVPSLTLIHYHNQSFNQVSDAQLDAMEKNWKKMVDKYGPDDIYSKLER